MNSLILPQSLRLGAAALLPRPFLPTIQSAILSTSPISRSQTKATKPLPTEEQLGSELSYVVKRTVSQGLPVYRKWKAGHTREIILVKKVEGNRSRLVEDLIGGLGVAGDRIRVNPTTQHVELQGEFFDKTKDWLLQKGF
ncbi:54S ribosomal protein img2 [Escovopsis weberi]|uniref:Large ribosomal subunit protein mL49 n=1 Tax=Escovopsis weberi TaxID=150374 RepID=A0A0M9VSK9_ESCWE|nr:54S ribosomal protein img2 [Escovopsis weberi]